jgi:hypothetical protein
MQEQQNLTQEQQNFQNEIASVKVIAFDRQTAIERQVANMTQQAQQLADIIKQVADVAEVESNDIFKPDFLAAVLKKALTPAAKSKK